MKNALYVCACILLLSLSGAVLYTALVTLPGARADLRGTLDRTASSAERAAQILDDARADLAVTQAAFVAVADRNAKTLAGSVAGTLKKADGTLEAVATIPAAASPVLEQAADALQSINAAAIDITATVDDLYPDILAGVQTAIVAERSAAESFDAVAKAAPAVADAAQRSVPQILDNSAAITKNVRRTTGLPAVIGRALLKAGRKLLFFL